MRAYERTPYREVPKKNDPETLKAITSIYKQIKNFPEGVRGAVMREIQGGKLEDLAKESPEEALTAIRSIVQKNRPKPGGEGGLVLSVDLPNASEFPRQRSSKKPKMDPRERIKDDFIQTHHTKPLKPRGDSRSVRTEPDRLSEDRKHDFEEVV